MRCFFAVNHGNQRFRNDALSFFAPSYHTSRSAPELMIGAQTRCAQRMSSRLAYAARNHGSTAGSVGLACRITVSPGPRSQRIRLSMVWSRVHPTRTSVVKRARPWPALVISSISSGPRSSSLHPTGFSSIRTGPERRRRRRSSARTNANVAALTRSATIPTQSATVNVSPLSCPAGRTR